MKYYIGEINRAVELDDELVKEYEKYDEIIDSTFTITICSNYGEHPSQEDVSDEELSKICNKILFGELKVMAVLPKFLNYFDSHYEEWTNNELHGIDLDEV